MAQTDELKRQIVEHVAARGAQVFAFVDDYKKAESGVLPIRVGILIDEMHGEIVVRSDEDFDRDVRPTLNAYIAARQPTRFDTPPHVEVPRIQLLISQHVKARGIKHRFVDEILDGDASGWPFRLDLAFSDDDEPTSMLFRTDDDFEEVKPRLDAIINDHYEEVAAQREAKRPPPPEQYVQKFTLREFLEHEAKQAEEAEAKAHAEALEYRRQLASIRPEAEAVVVDEDADEAAVEDADANLLGPTPWRDVGDQFRAAHHRRVVETVAERLEYGDRTYGPRFRGDPGRHLFEELVDALFYANVQAQRIEYLEERVRALGGKTDEDYEAAWGTMSEQVEQVTEALADDAEIGQRNVTAHRRKIEAELQAQQEVSQC